MASCGAALAGLCLLLWAAAAPLCSRPAPTPGRRSLPTDRSPSVGEFQLHISSLRRPRCPGRRGRRGGVEGRSPSPFRAVLGGSASPRGPQGTAAPPARGRSGRLPAKPADPGFALGSRLASTRCGRRKAPRRPTWPRARRTASPLRRAEKGRARRAPDPEATSRGALTWASDLQAWSRDPAWPPVGSAPGAAQARADVCFPNMNQKCCAGHTAATSRAGGGCGGRGTTGGAGPPEVPHLTSPRGAGTCHRLLLDDSRGRVWGSPILASEDSL